MGGLCSFASHPAEKDMVVRNMKPLRLQPQPLEIFADLETENDMKGRVAVDHIFTSTREVYGQPAADMENNVIDWVDRFKIELTNRPSPYDFPAFAHEKPTANKCEMPEIAEQQDKRSPAPTDTSTADANTNTLGG